MTQNEALTYGAVAFAAFTLFYVFRKTPTKAIAAQPGQQARDAALASWLTLTDNAQSTLSMENNMSQYRGLSWNLGI